MWSVQSGPTGSTPRARSASEARATALAVGALGLGTGTGLSLSSRCSSMTREILRPCCSVPGCCEDR